MGKADKIIYVSHSFIFHGKIEKNPSGGGAEERRKRSREYTKPEDIKLSPVPKRDPFTGKIDRHFIELIYLLKIKIYFRNRDFPRGFKNQLLLERPHLPCCRDVRIMCMCI
jgi:hypothetical protein